MLSACKGTDVAIIDAKKATVAAPEASKEMDDKEKFANAAALRKWIRKHPKGVAVLFAHWCPHCKAMIAQLAEVAKGAPEGVAFLACNAEAVSADASSAATTRSSPSSTTPPCARCSTGPSSGRRPGGGRGGAEPGVGGHGGAGRWDAAGARGRRGLHRGDAQHALLRRAAADGRRRARAPARGARAERAYRPR